MPEYYLVRKLFNMKPALLFTFLLIMSELPAQNVGIGTTTPVNRLDISGMNNWDLINGEGDARIGNNNYRLKFGVALAGGGAGAAALMQYGNPNGFNLLNLGSQGKYILSLNGNLGRAGIGTELPGADLEISSTGSAVPKIMLTQPQTVTSPVRMRFLNSFNNQYWDIATYSADNAFGSTLSFINSNTGSTGFGINGNAAMIVNGTTGTIGQSLHSRGPAQPAYWASSTNQLYNNTTMLEVTEPFAGTGGYSVIPGLINSFSTTGNAKVLVSFNVTLSTPACNPCGNSELYFLLQQNGNPVVSTVVFRYDIPNGVAMRSFSGTHVFNVGPGNQTIQLMLSTSGPVVNSAPCCGGANSLIYQVIPQ